MLTESFYFGFRPFSCFFSNFYVFKIYLNNILSSPWTSPTFSIFPNHPNSYSLFFSLLIFFSYIAPFYKILGHPCYNGLLRIIPLCQVSQDQCKARATWNSTQLKATVWEAQLITDLLSVKYTSLYSSSSENTHFRTLMQSISKIIPETLSAFLHIIKCVQCLLLSLSWTATYAVRESW